MSNDTDRTSSYVAAEMPLGLDKELERLRNQTLITWAKEARNLRWLGLRDDMTVLELGSGPGFVSEGLLDLLRNGNLVSVEIDPVLVEKARSYLQDKAGSRWKLIEGNVMQIDLPDNTFDFVYARYLFQHLPEPVGAAKEALRLLKPGGKLVVTDVDDELVAFEPPAAGETKVIEERVMTYLKEHQASQGGNRLIGRRLTRVLRDAGYQNMVLEALPMHNDLDDIGNLVPTPTVEGMQHLINAGVLTLQEAEYVVKDAQEFEASDPVILVLLLMAAGQKPATPQ
jgi:ubiquinone/menaquinone biosynthesis C-methylase UbiE